MFPFFRPSHETRRPPSMPPNFVPQKGQGKKVGTTAPTASGGASVFAVDTGAIFPCINQFVYIWPTNGPGFCCPVWVRFP